MATLFWPTRHGVSGAPVGSSIWTHRPTRLPTPAGSSPISPRCRRCSRTRPAIHPNAWIAGRVLEHLRQRGEIGDEPAGVGNLVGRCVQMDEPTGAPETPCRVGQNNVAMLGQ